jgi:hypothetical protein
VRIVRSRDTGLGTLLTADESVEIQCLESRHVSSHPTPLGRFYFVFLENLTAPPRPRNQSPGSFGGVLVNLGRKPGVKNRDAAIPMSGR